MVCIGQLLFRELRARNDGAVLLDSHTLRVCPSSFSSDSTVPSAGTARSLPFTFMQISSFPQEKMLRSLPFGKTGALKFQVYANSFPTMVLTNRFKRLGLSPSQPLITAPLLANTVCTSFSHLSSTFFSDINAVYTMQTFRSKGDDDRWTEPFCTATATAFTPPASF